MGTTPGASQPSFTSNILTELDRSSRGGPWWNTPTAAVIVDLAKAGPFVTALAGIAEVLRAGEDPEWAVGGVRATAAFTVAQEWLSAGVEPSEVGDWLRAGCWDPKAARRMVDVGLRPFRLLNEDGKPAHWIEAGNGAEMSLALAVADGFMSPEDAVRVVTR
jgi:hypothetical protein